MKKGFLFFFVCFCTLFALIKTLLTLPILPLTLFWDVRKSEKKLLEKNGQEPVLFLHGFLASEKFWFYHYRSLEEKGAKNLFTVQLGTPFTSIEKCAEIVEARIQEILKETKSRSIKLVCHSMGGLVALYYMRHLQKEEKVSLCIAIGSPFLGTLPAILIGQFFAPCKQMEYKSYFTKSLSEEVPIADTLFVHIYSHADLIVWPHSSSYPVLSKKRVVVEFYDVGHIQALFSKKVKGALADFLHF